MIFKMELVSKNSSLIEFDRDKKLIIKQVKTYPKINNNYNFFLNKIKSKLNIGYFIFNFTYKVIIKINVGIHC